jgi:tetratricopeptide (TPR) repeat protein
MSRKAIRRNFRRGRDNSRNACRLFATLFLVLFASSEPVSATSRAPVEGSADRCYKSNDPGTAIRYCTQAIESRQLSGKHLAFAFYTRGNAYNEQREFDRAIEDYNEAIRLNPRHANGFSNRGVAFTQKGEYDRAIESFNDAIRLDPNHVDAFTNRGVALTRKGEYDRAIESFNDAIRLNPNRAGVRFDRGNAHRLKSDYNRAIDDYNEAIRLNPNHASAFSNRGIAYGRKGEYDLAIQSYGEALRLNPKNVNALYNRGNAYTRKGVYDLAVQDYDQVLRINPRHANAYSSRGIARFLQGQFSAALPDLSEAVKFAPDDLHRILLHYLAQVRAGNHDREALAHATQGLDLAKWPGPIVSMYLGKVPAKDVLDSLADANGTERTHRRCQAYFYLGQQMLIRQQRNEAAKMFRETVATSSRTLFEYEAARAELKRLGNDPADTAPGIYEQPLANPSEKLP